jgi:hypothetical protein
VGKKETAQVQLAKVKQRTIFYVVDKAYLVAVALIKYGCLALVVYFAYLAFAAAAGKDTKFSAIVLSTLKLSIDRYASYLLSLILYIAYRREKKLRLKTIKELGEYPKDLEKTVDPNRSGSGLDSYGNPRKEDLDESGS